MSENKPNSNSDPTLVVVFLLVGTFIWVANPFPFFGVGPLQVFLSDEFYLRTIEQLKQAGMLHPFSKVFIRIEIQAVLLLALAIMAFIRRSKKLAMLYAGLIIVLSIVPWLKFASELSQTH